MLLVLGQGGWWDGWRPPALGEDAEWERLAALLDWRPFEALLAPLRNARRGRPGYPPLALFRGLLVRERNNLSTRGLERALRQSLVLRRFCGFASGDPTPDHSTFSRFHGALARHGLAARCFAELERQLDAQGLFRKQGGLIDATLLQAQLRPPPYRAGPGARHPLDGDASWTRSGYTRSALFGCKAHLNVDLGSLLIRSAALSPAHLAERGAEPGPPGRARRRRPAAPRRRVRDLRGQGLRRAAMARAGDGAGRQRPHHAPRAQASTVDRAGAAAQPANRAGAPGGRAGLRHPQAALPLPPGAASRAGAQRGRTAPEVLLLQPAPRAGVARRLSAARTAPLRTGRTTPRRRVEQPTSRPTPVAAYFCTNLLPGGRLGGGWDAASVYQRRSRPPAFLPAQE